MTYDEWTKVVRHLKKVYTNDKFIPTKDVSDLWFGYLKEIEYVYIRMAVKEWVEKSEYYPTIADIRNAANKFHDETKAKLRELKDIFQTCHSYYPSNLTADDDWISFKAAIKSEGFTEAKTKALKIKSEIMKAEELTKPFKEYVNEISGTKHN